MKHISPLTSYSSQEGNKKSKTHSTTDESILSKENKKMNELKLNDVVFFVCGVQVIKCVIEETIQHYTQKGLIEKFILRGYGKENPVTVERIDIYLDYKKAEIEVKERIERSYKLSVENLKKMDEKSWDAKEKAYQEDLKKENKDES